MPKRIMSKNGKAKITAKPNNILAESRTFTEQPNHPSYYNVGKIEVWDAITDWDLDFLSGNVVKYIVRAGRKQDRLVDLIKTRNYVNKLIEIEEKKQNRNKVMLRG